jgi:hypothetical protein
MCVALPVIESAIYIFYFLLCARGEIQADHDHESAYNITIPVKISLSDLFHDGVILCFWEITTNVQSSTLKVQFSYSKRKNTMIGIRALELGLGAWDLGLGGWGLGIGDWSLVNSQ